MSLCSEFLSSLVNFLADFAAFSALKFNSFNGDFEAARALNLQKNSNFIKQEKGDRIFYISDYVLIKKDKNENFLGCFIKTTPGRILLNEAFK